MSRPRRLTLEHLRLANSFPGGWFPPANTRRRVVATVRAYLRDPATGPADRVMLVGLLRKLQGANLARVRARHEA